GILSLVVLFFLFFIIIMGLVASSSEDDKVDVKENSILRITLSENISERSVDNPFENFDFMSFENNSSLGLKEIITTVAKAKDDQNIKGIYLDLSMVSGGLTTVEEIRNALIDFKKSNKFIYAYSEIYTQKAYYLASVADSVYLNPAGLLELKGFNAQYMFFKGALDKLEIEPQIIRVGSFKSAVEPYMQTQMSDSNRLQTSVFMGSIFNHMIANIADARKLNTDSVNSIAVDLKVRNAEDAVKYKLADALRYKDEVLNTLMIASNRGSIKDLNFIDLKKYVKSAKPNISTDKNKIAVIYANGEIVGGEGNENIIGSEGISRAIRQARLDDQVKAVVLRVNSPGGSALASDVMWREIVLTKKVKPVIVSMGDVAASGGYYIACAADVIVAEPTTITGSIGVFGILFNAQKFFNNKLGITFDQVKTGKYADLGDYTRALTESERFIIQNEVNRIYEDFTQKVALGRNMPIEKVKSIAEGRVWSGIDAKRIGLIDEFGNTDTAIAIAAKKAKLSSYRVISLPEIEDPIKKLMRNLSTEAKIYFMPEEYKALLPYAKTLDIINNNKGIQTRALNIPEIK
ncbi:MAG: signal peptide peptidase SppA, partial [bacterium]